MLSLTDNNQADFIETFNCTSRYLDDLLNIDNHYFQQMVDQIYPTEKQFKKANSLDTEAPFLDLDLFKIVKFTFLDGEVLPRFPSYGVYISQLIRFAKVCCNVILVTSTTEKKLNAKLLKQGYNNRV